MRIPSLDPAIFKERRQRLADKTRHQAVVLSAMPEAIRNHDVHYAYRQDTNLFYLTGFEEPESCLIFRAGKTPESVLFVRNKDPLRETWDGFRYGPEGTEKGFLIDKAYSMDEFETVATDLLVEMDDIHYTFFKNREFDASFMRVLEKIKTRRGRSGRGIPTVHDAYPLIGEMRIKKSPVEIDWLKKACQISAEAHMEVMKATRPGVNERALAGLFLKAIMERGSPREGYGSIVASGNNATTLHYTFNDAELKAGDLLLVDAGAEYNFFSGDITRTYPVSGKFSLPQRRLYERLLIIQKNLIASLKPGVTTLKALQDRTVEDLTDLMIEEGLLRGTRKDRIADMSFKKYYPHGVGHFLGMDVHDAGFAEVDQRPRPLEPGMTFTIEPGIYVPANDENAPRELRGIGIRIEDDVLMTDSGFEVLTTAMPKDIHALERT
jgi:Xaa-Pro aminopeptidase